MKLHFSRYYLLVTLLLFMIEVAIAYFHFNPFIRGFVGDVLVILLLYSFLKIFIRNNTFKIAVSVLVFAFLVEISQYFKIHEVFSIQSKVIIVILGSVFDVLDLVAYFIGFLLIIVIERFFYKKYTSVFF